jgi:CRISPR-associated endonuclease/helicase Cas3
MQQKNNIYQYWGKADTKDQKSIHYHPLPYHCLDVAAVIYLLLYQQHRYCTEWARRTGLCEEQISCLVVLAFMLHDIGKFSVTFQSLNPKLFTILFPNKKQKEYIKRHDTLGFLIWREKIKQYIASQNKELSDFLDIIIKSSLGHHGVPPEEDDKGGALPLKVSRFFDKEDCDAVLEFVQQCIVFLQPPELPLNPKSFKDKLKEISWEIAGVGFLADWIGSDISFFPYMEKVVPLEKYWKDYAIPRAIKALDHIRWTSTKCRQFIGINTLFPFISDPTPLQACVTSMAIFQGPKLFIIEDVTGSGKTEAAVVLAARMLAEDKADGIYIALPTMATANAMYSRMSSAYRNLFAIGERPSLVLSHGARHLSTDFTESIVINNQEEISAAYSDHETTASANCNSWYADNRKKSLLADVGVGTIDQILMAVLPVRHQALRLVGLHRKIIIVDEIHAYDPYMLQLLGVLLEAHARAGGSAILLSATLPIDKRVSLIKHFYAGLSESDIDVTTLQKTEFPLITMVNKAGIESYPIATKDEAKHKINIAFFHYYDNVLQYIKAKSDSGSCVCWIRNTVDDTRKAFFDLIKIGIPLDKIDLFHSRFAMVDRVQIENRTIAYFGKRSSSKERNGRVLVASQVVEQSLDLDFDELISDLAPIDLIIQRAGRLHRHIRSKNGDILADSCNRDERPDPILYVYAPEFVESADKTWLSGDFSGTAAIYTDRGKLWRTQKVLIEKKHWIMPDDARYLIEFVYGEENSYNVPEGLTKFVDEAEGMNRSKQAMGDLNALILRNGYCRNAVTFDQWNEDDHIPTRLTEENTEIVLAVYLNNELLPYAQVEDYPWDWSSLSISKKQWDKCKYHLPPDLTNLIDELKKKNHRLSYSNFVIVDERSDSAHACGRRISKLYDPRLGWGDDFQKEETH